MTITEINREKKRGDAKSVAQELQLPPSKVYNVINGRYRDRDLKKLIIKAFKKIIDKRQSEEILD